jgi:hypothetical protein
MDNLTRFNEIMALVDAWAEENAGWDCREEAEQEVHYILNARTEEFGDWTNEMVADAGIAAWEVAE